MGTYTGSPAGIQHRSCCGGCGWIQVIQDRLFPSVRPILDYLFLEAANGPPRNEDGFWDMVCLPSSQFRVGPVEPAEAWLESSLVGQRFLGLGMDT